MSRRFDELAGLTPADLEALLREGRKAAPEALVGYLWHGMALAMAAPLFSLFGRFGKTFYDDPLRKKVRGWNVRMRQDEAAWAPALFRGRPVTYGHYELITHPAGGLAATYPNAFLIDYGKGGNRAWDPLALVRDWIVEVDDDVLLGRMYLALGGRQVPTPSYFGLARGTPLSDIVEPPVSR